MSKSTNRHIVDVGPRGKASAFLGSTSDACAGKPHAAFDEAGAGNVAMVVRMRSKAKAMDLPTTPTVLAPALDPTCESWSATPRGYSPTVLHSQSERKLSDWTAYREVTIAPSTDALSGTNAADAALAVAGAGQSTQSNASRPLWILRHRRKHSSLAQCPSGCGALLAQDGKQSELERRGEMEAVPSNPDPVPADPTSAVSSLLEATGSRHAVKQSPKSVVQQVRTLRSVGAGWATAFGDPVASREARPYRDPMTRSLPA